MTVIFWISSFVIFWAMFGYPACLKLLHIMWKSEQGKSVYKKQEEKDMSFFPSITVMTVAHNEEKVIWNKLENLCKLDYPFNYKIIVASDRSTDRTNLLVKEFITAHPERTIILYESKEHKGKTNVQNEAQKLVESEILVMTDANAMFEKDALLHLVQPFQDRSVSYVCGQLRYRNIENKISNTESFYWNIDLSYRKMESDISTITAGNGAIYACRNQDYIILEPSECHDIGMPLQYGLEGKKAKYCERAVAYEKAGENAEDEYKRKVRMNRGILYAMLPDIRLLHLWKHPWFSFFYFGHRTCRYSLWWMHVLLIISNIWLIEDSIFYGVTFGLQLIFYLCALLYIVFKIDRKIFRLIFYYTMTILAQWNGVLNILRGKTKPTWEKAESTRG